MGQDETVEMHIPGGLMKGETLDKPRVEFAVSPRNERSAEANMAVGLANGVAG